MNQYRYFLAIALLFVSQANAALPEFLNETDNYKYTFAVYDIRPMDFSSEKLEKILIDAVQTYADKARVSHGIPPQTLPNAAPRMILKKVSFGGIDTYNPQCTGEFISIGSVDTSFSKYGETTSSKACAFKYKDGYRINYYGQFLQKTGVSSGTLGASLGRMFTKAVGLGDSSKFMKGTMDRLEKGLAEAGAEVKLVELYPDMEGKVVVADPAPKMSPQDEAAIAADSNTMPAGFGNLPAGLQELIVAKAQVQSAAAQQRQANLAAQQAAIQSVTDPKIQARKDLTAMGLTYHSQDQFVEAIKRGDKLAVELYLKAGAVNSQATTADGKSLSSLSPSQDVSNLLSQQGQQTY